MTTRSFPGNATTVEPGTFPLHCPTRHNYGKRQSRVWMPHRYTAAHEDPNIRHSGDQHATVDLPPLRRLLYVHGPALKIGLVKRTRFHVFNANGRFSWQGTTPISTEARLLPANRRLASKSTTRMFVAPEHRKPEGLNAFPSLVTDSTNTTPKVQHHSCSQRQVAKWTTWRSFSL